MRNTRKEIKNTKLYVLMGESGLTQKSVADRAGMSDKVVANALVGVRIYPRNQIKIAASFNKTLEDCGFDAPILPPSNGAPEPEALRAAPQKWREAQVNIGVSKELKTALSAYCKENKVSITAFLTGLMIDAMKSNASASEEITQEQVDDFFAEKAKAEDLSIGDKDIRRKAVWISEDWFADGIVAGMHPLHCTDVAGNIVSGYLMSDGEPVFVHKDYITRFLSRSDLNWWENRKGDERKSSKQR